MTLLAVLCCLTLSAVATDDAATMSQARSEAKRAADATLAGEWATLIKLTHPKVVELAGGREKMLEMLTTQMSQMKQEGIVLKSSEVKAPTDLAENGDTLYCIVPTTNVIQVPMGTITSQSYLVGVSEDGGKTWAFIDSSPGPEKIRQIFPEIPADLELPEKTAPKFEPEPAARP